MKRSILLLLLAAACRTSSVPVTVGTSGASSAVGASNARGALDLFLAAAKAQDLQALSSVWGDESGPTRDRFPRKELEQRELILLCLLKHDQARVGDLQRSEGNRLIAVVDMTQGRSSASVKFTMAKGPADRWFVQDLDTKTLQNSGFCTKATGNDSRKP